MRPNVLLVILDAARRDALEPYGAPSGSSPATGQLARRGTALPDVYATGCWTIPSHSSIFTGLLPRAAGLSRVRSPSEARPLLNAHRDRLLSEVLRRAGYSTGAVSANLWISEASGFDAGFDDFVQVNTGRHARIDASAPRDRLRWLVEAAIGHADDGAAGVEETLGAWISTHDRRPFFWFVNLIESHSPYLPPRSSGGVSTVDRLRAAEDARRYYTLDAIWRTCLGERRVPEPTLKRMRRLYRASIRYMDDWLGRVLERLDAARLLDDTLVIVTADHGENFGEGGLITHAFSLDNRLIRVPFVMAGPGVDRSGINSLAELPRLVADAVGLDRHPWNDGPPHGIGVAQFDPPADPGDAEAVDKVERLGLAHALEQLTTPLTCAVNGSLKLLRRGDREEIYDLLDDPLESSPLEAGDGRARREELQPLRDALEHPAVSSRWTREAVATAPEASAEELRELEERMRLLGYM